MNQIKIFGIGSTKNIASAVCKELKMELSHLCEEKFPDGELAISPKEDVANKNVFVFCSLGGNQDRSVNDRLCELYFFLSSLRDLGAMRVTAMVPYLAYARSDQRKEAMDSVLNKYVAQMLEGSGVHRIVTLDVHNISAFENAFRCPCLNLEAAKVFCQYVDPHVFKDNPPVVLSPDFGGIRRAEIFRLLLESSLGIPVETAFLEKFRIKNKLSGHKLTGSVKGRKVFIIDDMISTGSTILRAMSACQSAGATAIKVFSTHAVFSKNQNELLNSPLVDEVIVTDSHPSLLTLAIPVPSQKLKVLSCAPIFANVIRMEDGYENFSVRRHNDRTGD